MPDVRAAAARLSPRERGALIAHLRQAADHWAPVLPDVAGFWAAVADQLCEVDHLERVRAAAQPQRELVRTAKRWNVRRY